MDPVYLIDISAYLHRAMHVVYGDRAATVEAADTGFIDHAGVMLANTMVKLGIKRMAVVCDSIAPSFRCESYPAYKAGRKPHTPVFAAQMPVFFDALRDIDVSVFDEERYEADDLIATLVRQEVVPYVIVSHDKDLLALVSDAEQICAYNPMSDKWTREADVVAKFGVKPGQLYDYLGLLGDTADGIPGVEDIGAKTAAKLLTRFGTLDGIYADEAALQASFVTKKQFESLLSNKDNAFLSRALAVPIIHDAIDLTGHGPMPAPDPDFVRAATRMTRRPF